jgi:hypothetical protein
MRLYALVEAGELEATDVCLCEQGAQRPLEDCFSGEPLVSSHRLAQVATR